MVNEAAWKLLRTSPFMFVKSYAVRRLLRDVEIERIRVKHLEIIGRNTLTTPKIVLTNAAADPVNNGEITLNGTTIRGKSAGVVKDIGGTIATDETAQGVDIATVNAASVSLQHYQDVAYVIRKSIVLTPDTATNRVILCGTVSAFALSSGWILAGKIDEGAGNVVAEVTDTSVANTHRAMIVAGILTDVSAAAHTYDLKGKSDTATHRQVASTLYGAVIKAA